MKLIIFGASGAGTTTLAQSLGHQLGWTHLDADDYYWANTPIPYEVKVPLEERHENLRQDLEASKQVIISGSLVTWGKYWLQAFDLGIFLRIPHEVRMERLKQREIDRYGKALESEYRQKKMHEFLTWASQYDDPSFASRNISQHRRWIELLECEVLEIDGDFTNEARMQKVLDKIEKMKSKK
ncbi:hypothetical protein BKI52_39065 [marine bacterium AO1-C]|nr:hypothetical protein BKI52_39065 [marine bacterium AO1-C]